MIEFIRGLVAKEPARLVGYGSSLAVAGALKLAELIGVTIPADVLAAISLFTGFVISELIRRFVYAPATVQAIANEATHLPPGTEADIGKPPAASPPLADNG